MWAPPGSTEGVRGASGHQHEAPGSRTGDLAVQLEFRLALQHPERRLPWRRSGEGREDAPGCLTHIVQDILAGFFIITECQYGFGDLIRLSVPSLPDPAIGTVEDVTLRVTTVRNADGEVVITPTARSPR